MANTVRYIAQGKTSAVLYVSIFLSHAGEMKFSRLRELKKQTCCVHNNKQLEIEKDVYKNTGRSLNETWKTRAQTEPFFHSLFNNSINFQQRTARKQVCSVKHP